MKKALVLMAIFAGMCLASRRIPFTGKEPGPSELDKLIAESSANQFPAVAPSPGSLYVPGSGMIDLAADLRARQLNDLVTVLILDRASAIARGTSKSARTSSAAASVDALAGIPPVGGARLQNLLKLGSNTSLDGQGETSRETILNTTLTTRVTHVLPNGLLVVQGAKSVRVNSETQQIAIRGVVRAVDLTTDNRVSSDSLAYLEITVNGKGIVGDAIRRPNFLYRLLLGLLPF
ncbi:MAG: flagellar basal body L-ring protein FlgH [Bryobacteraceae bacterium]|nr:flagellar basal body L-ring protein FlgH [Bryobacteraceae bacterium]